MTNEFSFTLVEQSDIATKVIFAPENKDLVEHIFDSYDFEMIDSTPQSFVLHEKLDDVFDDLTDYEIDDEDHPTLLTEEDEGFYTTPSDELYEIQVISVYDPSLSEGAVKRTVAIRGGKRKVIFKCGAGQMKVGRTCRRRPTAQLNKMKRRARISARKARKKRRLANRKRKLSLKRRAVLVRKKPSHK